MLYEFSGIVRDAFRAKGHDAISVDLLPSECTGPHLQTDAIDALHACEEWADLLVCHPPCTRLAVSGAHLFKKYPEEQKVALEVVRTLLTSKVPKKCLENPIGVISTKIRPPDQIIQPWQFGHPESKSTCLWLEGLPLLTPTNILTKPGKYWANQTPSGQNKLGPSPDRWKERSRTYWGIAQAMAEQWGG